MKKNSDPFFTIKKKMNKPSDQKSILNGFHLKELLNIKDGYNCRFNLSATPYSYQSEKQKKELYKKIIQNEIKRRKLDKKYKKKFSNCELELQIIYYLGSKYNKSDLDNFTKILQDQIKNRIFGDDSKIKRLVLIKEFIPKTKFRRLFEQSIIKIKRL